MKKEQEQKKICYVMQERTGGTHMDYVYEMARTLRKEKGLLLTLLIEKGECAPEDQDWCVEQTFRFAPLRILENFVRILGFRFSGYKIFYVHYSFVSAISAGIVTKLFGGTVYYWNCGQPWMYERPFLTDLYQKCAYKLIDYLVTGVEAVVPGYMETYRLKREQIRIIPNWIDFDSIRRDPFKKIQFKKSYNLSGDTKILLFLHTLSTRYGAEFLPEILEQLKDEDIHLMVAGDGGLRSNLEQEFIKRDIQDKVTMLGYAERDVVEDLLNASDIFLMPSEGAGSPHSLIEAMAHGLPFVAFDVGGVRETAPPETSDYIYKYGDVHGLVSGIILLLHKKQSYQSVQESEYIWINQFSKEQITNKFHLLLQGK